ncbi:DNA-(apurinic or apyrimidinic site) lyase [Prosthecobacter fusiformis]|uniref:Formamidopyrimidine-DNA glycosylase n=1 Tax=Prosthecobacter fusiformis TaxID=48464 RepID=A0A4R7RJX4_9BACT|nr:bifunctional DNA-formamidopyrimidine glycosylase/DNA-(apurinic or apyrimidinic site) lyase [Prosthecobacter fusiformis]TDU63125.1 DNA-(apurinic or apyrimidinic site) lyase [Prosthecobacter fusiformis]
MPELPEVETTLRGVSPHLVGRRIREVIVRESRLRWPIPDTIHELEGSLITAGNRRGKYLLFTSAKGTLLLHLGMSGSLRVTDPATPWRKHDHLALTTDRDMQVRLHDPRRFGAALFIHGDPLLHPLLAELGPEPLSEAFTAAHLKAACRGRIAPIKSLIMDSHIVVGVGNIYACEALFMAGISPMKAAGKVSTPRLLKLVQAIRQVLAASIEMGGTTLRDFLNEKGEPGYFKQTLRVYDRESQPCPTCTTPIQRQTQNNRSTFHCPKCQR